MLNKIDDKIYAQFDIIEDSIKYQIEELTEILGIISFIKHLEYFKEYIS